MGRIWQWSVALIYIILIVNDESVSCQSVVNSCGCQSQYVNNQPPCNNGIGYPQTSTINGPSYGSSVNQGAILQTSQTTLQGGTNGAQQNIQTIQSATAAVNRNPIVPSPNLPCRSPSLTLKPSACAPSISQRLVPQYLSSPSIQPQNSGFSSVPTGCGQTQPVYPNLPPYLCGNCGSQSNLYQPASATSQTTATAASQASVNEVISSGYPSDITQLNSIASSSVQSSNIQPSPYVPQQFVNQYPVRPPSRCVSSPVRYGNPLGNCQCQQSPQAYPNQQQNIFTEQSVATATSTATAVGQQNIASGVQSAAVSQQSIPSTGQQSAVAIAESTVVNPVADVSSQQAVASSQQTSVVSEETATSQQAVASTQQAVASTQQAVASTQQAVAQTQQAVAVTEESSVASAQSEVSSATSSSSVEQSTAVAAVDTTATQEVVSSSTTSSAAQSSLVASTTQLLPKFILNPVSGSQILPINVPTKILLTNPCSSPPSPPCPIYPPIQPIILQNSNSNSNMKTLLPIFIATLFNDGCACNRGRW